MTPETEKKIIYNALLSRAVEESFLPRERVCAVYLPEEAGELLHTIRALKSRGLAIVWIEHIVHVLVQVIDRLVCLDGGRIIADAAPQAVLANESVIAAYLGEGLT